MAVFIFYKFIFPMGELQPSGQLQNSNEFNYAYHLFLFLVRISYIALTLCIFVWISKRYLITRNNEIVYRHIATVLKTFKSFYETAEKEHKGLVLMEAAKVVFPAPLEKTVETQMDSAKMLDVVRLLSQATNKGTQP